ncbi:zwei Ig domain protein zig-8-like [Schistocerca piceifrons]|uniref:zwei Ig domain protein zig-8-like n=1 Tax=Schistocerca piceifrons TaxID=274613 RepID=UPI001F5EFD8F|nr:zwei Ig domain protein zig-8-like [Schistocerca piceifrons]
MPPPPLLLLLLPLSWWLLAPAGGWEPPVRHHGSRHHHEHHWGPRFELEDGGAALGPRAVAVPLGGTALLDCRVAMLRDKTVAWLRLLSDRVSLLTVGDSAYSADPRLSVRFQYPNNWRLAIEPVRRQDEGSYLCEVATHPPRLLAVNLTVIAPDLEIVDESGRSARERYYQTGSAVELWCRVLGDTQPPSRRTIWTKDGQPLPLGAAAQDIPEGESLSRLRLPFADKSHSGEYTCSLGHGSDASVHVHVLNGETQAAVHHETWSAARRPHQPGAASLLLSGAVAAAAARPRIS